MQKTLSSVPANERTSAVKPPRRPSSTEIALWEQATKDLKPLKARPSAPILPKMRAQITQPPVNPTVPASKQSPLSVENATLDGQWDALLRRGRVSIEDILDLHGYTLEQAFRQLERAVHKAYRSQARVLLVITGKGNPNNTNPNNMTKPTGVLRTQLPLWLEASSLRPLVAALRPAHPRHGGSGAWYVILRRAR
jgi:DNA-nicking Smr family endonuclease